jgi:FkbM family methyltransferase
MESDEISDRLAAIERKLERIWSRIEEVSSRSSSYLGDGVSSTYLRNGNLIYVNSNDFGPPANFIDGGDYEPDNLQVLLSFIHEDTVFVDVGANLGFFSLVIGDRMRRAGRVIAFEPQPRMVDLLQRSIHHNGLLGIVEVHPIGLSEITGRLSLWVPKNHKGGGTLRNIPESQRRDFDLIAVDARRLDDLFGDGFTCDLVKIDVEGHELSVLRGMREVIARSPAIKILLEKLGAGDGSEPALHAFFTELGMELYGVAGPGLSGPLALADIRAWQGYLLAARPSSIDDLDRRRFSIFPRQMMGGSSRLDGARLVAAGPGLMAHGPYWSLPRGTWRLTVQGEVRGDVTCVVSERFGQEVAAGSVSGPGQVADFIIEHDLTKFECAFWGAAGARIAIDRLDWRLIG